MFLEKKNICNPNTGTAVDKRREDFAVVTAYGRTGNPQTNTETMHAHTLSRTHCEYMSDISESFHSLT